MNTIKRVSSLIAAAAVGVTGTYLAMPGAEAIPNPQEKCTFGVIGATPATGWVSFGMDTTIKNGTKPRRVVARLAADMGVDTGAEIRVGYKVDGGAIQEGVYGPTNLANHTEYWETRATQAVIPVPAGQHTIRVYWRVNGPAGKNGVFSGGCFTVEGRTS